VGYYSFMATETILPTLSTGPASAPYVYRTPAEDAATIRAELKRRGWSSRQVSVRSDSFSMGSSITVTIKAAGIPLATVREIAERAEHIHRCEVTGDILGGGNRYVSVHFDRTLLASVAVRFRPALDAMYVPATAAWPPVFVPFMVAGQTFHVARLDSCRYRCFDGAGTYVPAQTAGCVADVFARIALEAGEA